MFSIWKPARNAHFNHQLPYYNMDMAHQEYGVGDKMFHSFRRLIDLFRMHQMASHYIFPKNIIFFWEILCQSDCILGLVALVWDRVSSSIHNQNLSKTGPCQARKFSPDKLLASRENLYVTNPEHVLENLEEPLMRTEYRYLNYYNSWSF